MITRIALLIMTSTMVLGQTPNRHDLIFSKLPTRWDEALPLGNGMVGALIWQKDGKLRVSLDRADLWDLRPTEDLDKLTFSKVQQHVAAGTYAEVQRLGDLPYERDPAPTKIPGAALEFDTRSVGDILSSRVFINEGIAHCVWKNNITFTSFIHPSLPLGWFRLEGADIVPEMIPPRYADTSNAQEGNSVQGQGLGRLGYAQGKIQKSESLVTYVQEGWNGFTYSVTVQWRKIAGGLEGVWSITSNAPTAAIQSSEQLTSDALSRGYTTDLSAGKIWWENFWSQSSVSLPDDVLERQWYLEQYKFGCVARANTPPITLQAVWTADNGNLPPWKGDIHNDLNIQLSYWPAYSGNHLREAEGMVNWLHQSRPEFERWTSAYFGVKGLNVPGVCTLDGKAMGGWIQYSLSPTTAGWLGHHFYLHWRYTLDRDFLRNRAYPWLRDVATFFTNLSVVGSDGKKRLPLSSSPEFYDNNVQAWFSQTTNYDLSIIRWTYEKAVELATELQLDKEAVTWRKELEKWPALSVADDGSLALAPGHPYPESHRHFSHLLGIHPLGLINYDSEENRKLIDASVKALMAKGTRAWVGYSFAWLGNIYARMGKGEEAAESLRTFATCFCLPNSFHANGDQCGGKNSGYTYRPFTLEGNFAFAAGIQEMLLQSHGAVIRLFPAVPESWKNVGFERLRAEGGFVISAKRASGQITEVVVVSERGGTLVIENPAAIMTPAAANPGNRLRIETSPGQVLRFPSGK